MRTFWTGVTILGLISWVVLLLGEPQIVPPLVSTGGIVACAFKLASIIHEKDERP